ncbi:hypothetical protein C7433_101512 [Pantoea sp. PNA 03-3]|nr:hypothetical protein C7433_101512 [Pantoea sp. PNA 03-3]
MRRQQPIRQRGYDDVPPATRRRSAPDLALSACLPTQKGGAVTPQAHFYTLISPMQRRQ